MSAPNLSPSPLGLGATVPTHAAGPRTPPRCSVLPSSSRYGLILVSGRDGHPEAALPCLLCRALLCLQLPLLAHGWDPLLVPAPAMALPGGSCSAAGSPLWDGAVRQGRSHWPQDAGGRRQGDTAGQSGCPRRTLRPCSRGARRSSRKRPQVIRRVRSDS